MKKILFILSLAFALACNALVPTNSPNQGGVAFTKIRISPGDGALADQLAAEAAKAAALGQMPVVEFDASW